MKTTIFMILGFLFAFENVVRAEHREGKAVYETSSEKGMKLSDVALKNIEVETARIPDTRRGAIPVGSLVYFQDHVGVYRKWDGWFKLIKIEELKNGDEIVIHGADLMRVAELDAFGGGN